MRGLTIMSGSRNVQPVFRWLLIVSMAFLVPSVLTAQGRVGGGPPSRAGDGVLVQVNDDVILHSDVLSRIRPRLRQMARNLSRQEFRKRQRELFFKSVSFMIKEKVLTQEAEERGLSVPQKKVQEILDRQIEQAGSRGRFIAQLRQQGLTLDMWKRQLKTNLLNKRLFQKTFREDKNSFFVPPEEMKAYYENNKLQFYEEAKVKGHVISFPFSSADQRDQRLRQVRGVRSQLEEGATFQSLVDAYNDIDPEHTRSFDWTKKGEFLKPVQYLLFHGSFQDGQIRVLVADNRVLIVKRTGLIKAKQKPLSNPEVQKEIRSQIEQRKRQEKLENLRQKLIEEAFIQPRYLVKAGS